MPRSGSRVRVSSSAPRIPGPTVWNFFCLFLRSVRIFLLSTGPGGGTGRRAGLKILFAERRVRVRFPSGAQNKSGSGERRAMPSRSHFPSALAPFPALKTYLHPILPYESLDVYKKAYPVNRVIYRLLKSNKSIPGYTRDQLGRAILSIALNIAEGSAKCGSSNLQTS